MVKQKDFVFTIVGGGLVGCSLALALAPLGYRIALIEPNLELNLEHLPQDDFDRRAITLSLSSANILKALGVWPACVAEVTPITTIKISEKGRLGKAELHSRDYQLAAFGYVIPMTLLQAILEKAVKQHATIQQFRPDTVTAFTKIDQGWQCQLSHENLTTECLIASDGSRSFIREQLGIESTIKKLTECAVLANVTTQQPMNNTAYERFTAAGTVALLPIAANQATAVITTSPEDATRLKEEEVYFREVLQQRFGFSLGRFAAVGQRQKHPLIRLWAKRAVDDNLLLLGNAAHTLHPVAAQGFNLSLRDVAVFAELVADSVAPNDWSTCLKQYQHLRAADQQSTSDLTELTLRVFSLDFLPLRLLRGVGLTVLNSIPYLKRQLTQIGMGLGESGSKRLIYGQPLMAQEERHEGV